MLSSTGSKRVSRPKVISTSLLVCVNCLRGSGTIIIIIFLLLIIIVIIGDLHLAPGVRELPAPQRYNNNNFIIINNNSNNR